MKKKNKILICVEDTMYRKHLPIVIKEYTHSILNIETICKFEHGIKSLNEEIVDFLLIRFDRTIKFPIQFLIDFKKKFPKTKLIVLSFWDNLTYKNILIKAGAYAYAYYQIDTEIDYLINHLESKN